MLRMISKVHVQAHTLDVVEEFSKAYNKCGQFQALKVQIKKKSRTLNNCFVEPKKIYQSQRWLVV